MCNIKQQTRQPPLCEGRTWTYVNNQRVRVIFTDEPKPAEPHIVIERPDLQPLPPTKGMINFVNSLRAKYQLGGI